MTMRTVGGGALVAGAGIVGLGAAAIGGALLRDVLLAERAANDGPDDLLADPSRYVTARKVVTSADGTRLNVVDYGPDSDGDIVVAVHGWTCSVDYWNPQINHLAGRQRVVAYDQRGHGASELGRTRPTIATLGEDLDAVLEAVVPPGRRAVLLGHSMGGMTIMSWAARHPERVAERVSSVVLTSTAASALAPNHLLLPKDLTRYTRRIQPGLTRVLMATPAPVPHLPVGQRFSHYIALGSKARQSHVEFVDGMIMACPPRTRARWGSAMFKLDVLDGLDALTVPTTVVVGSEDRLTPRWHAEQMAEVLRAKGVLRDFVVYEGAGHMSSIEAALEYNELIDDILDEVAAAA